MKKKLVVIISLTIMLLSIITIPHVRTLQADTESFTENIPPITNKTSANINILADNSFELGQSTEVPGIYEGAKKYGIITSDIIKTSIPFKGVSFSVDKVISSNDILMLEASASNDQNKWTEFLEADDNNRVNFNGSFNFIRYRVTMISGSGEMKVNKISLKFYKESNKVVKPIEKSFKGTITKPSTENKQGNFSTIYSI
ncbi:hypothetical protein REC12_11765 [Desulfosporosinus sp. PR]|uniref:hypothetical protein n=1 Tax=Candidatus Desulfosporosinus nitrosoreducens TaxID=3401928 RepID=UPI0027E7E39C|nr:hypothetical protein [Desulfosporosinus sp. PR]MDQ7094266.1 hypothetical protein [Desulfosporosinus sp. PR]